MALSSKLKGARSHLGKQGELFVFGELLKRGMVPHVPLVDVDGVDAMVPVATGAVLKLQVKTVAAPSDPRWFQVDSVPEDLHLFYVCLEMQRGEPGDVWVFPAMVFDAYSSRPPKRTPRDLNLDSTRRGDSAALKEILAGFRNRWQLLGHFDRYADLLNHPEDLAGLLAAKEALEAPEEEATTLEEYKQDRLGVRG